MEDEFDSREFFNQLRRSASVKTGAVMFGEAQVAYYNVLKEHMSEEMAYNLLAHTTERIIKGLAHAAGPVTEALLQSAYIWDQFKGSDKEVPGG